MPEDIKSLSVDDFLKLAPQDAAHQLEVFKIDDALAMIQIVPIDFAAQVFDQIDPAFAADLVNQLPDKTAVQILSKITIPHAADLTLSIKSEEKRNSLLKQIDRAHADQIRKIMAYPDDSVGRIMTPSYLAFQTSMKVHSALQTLRFLVQRKIPMNYVYVIDDDKHLKGVLNMRELLFADDDATLEEVMSKNIFAVRATMDREKVIEEMNKRSYLSAPVVDLEGHLLGVIKTNDLLKSVQEEATEDIQKMFGAGGDERVFSPISFSLKKRIGWLYVNLLTAFMAAGVISLFENTLAKVASLAILMPIVASQGGNSGAQTLAIMIRGLALREVDPALAWKAIVKESKLGFLHGLLVGSVTAVGAVFWNRNPVIGLALGLAMVVNLVAAGMAGASIPIIMKALGKDPAQSSNIILTTVTDCVGYFSFLGLSTLLLPLILK